MALPISIRDAIDICMSIVSVYKFCRGAPSEMESAVERVEYVTTILESIQSSEQQLSFLASTNGQRLKRLLKSEISKLQRSLKRLQRLVLKWKKAWPWLYKRVMFLACTISEVPEVRADLEARMTGIDRILNLANLAGNKINFAQLNDLIAALRQPVLAPKRSVGKGDPERKAVKEALKVSGVTRGNAPRLDNAKKAHLLQALADQGVSRTKSELVTQLYEQESMHVLPEVPRRPDVSPNRQEHQIPIRQSPIAVPTQSQPKHTNRNSTCEILVVDSRNGYRSIIAHAYLEYYRAWVANNHGDWLFHRVESAGLDIKTPFRLSVAGKLDTDIEPLKEPGRTPDQTVLDAITGRNDFFATDNRPYEKASIIERIQAHRGRGLSKGFCSRYDYIVTFEPSYVTALEQLQRQALSSSSGHSPAGAKKSSRIVLLPKTTTAIGTIAKDYVPLIGMELAQFLSAEFGYERPPHSIINGGLRTSFMQIALPAQMRRVERGVESMESRTGCKVHMAAESVSYGWVVAIVGEKERLGEAEEMVRKLRGSDGL